MRILLPQFGISYQVEGKEVTRIYANTTPERAEKGVNGSYVVIEVKAEVDLNAQPKQPTPAEMEKKKERDRMQGGPVSLWAACLRSS